MRINEAGINLIKTFEGLELSAYVDPVGILTIGYGHTGPEVQEGMSISARDAEGLLRQDLERFETAVRNIIQIPVNDNEFSALVSLAYNIGDAALAASTAIRRLNGGDRLGAAEAIEWFNKATVNGRLTELPGLTRRRAAEKALFLMDPPNVKPAKPTEIPVVESPRILPSVESSGRRVSLGDSRTIQGAGTAGAVGTAAAGAEAIERSAETAAENGEAVSPQAERILQLMDYIPDDIFAIAAIMIMLAAGYAIYARADDWKKHRR